VSNIAPLLDRNRAFASNPGARQNMPRLPFIPILNLYIVICIDCRVDVKAPEGPYFEVAIVHHTDCGSTLLADDELRHGFAQRMGTSERTLADTPVLDPVRTVQTDVVDAKSRR
jgi:carbonic anhydrase